MKLFQQSFGMITIMSGDETVTVSLQLFQQCEPDYIPSPLPVRLWIEKRHCLNDGSNDYPDPDFSETQFQHYCNNIAVYRSLLPADDPTEPAQPATREQRLQSLNDDLHAYLTSRGYDTGTQMSFQAIYMDCLEKNITGQVKQRIQTAFDFVMGCVLPWYYDKKAEIEDTEEYLDVTWDFHSLDAQDPGVALRDIINMLSA